MIEQTKAKFAKVRVAHPEFEGKTAILADGDPKTAVPQPS